MRTFLAKLSLVAFSFGIVALIVFGISSGGHKAQAACNESNSGQYCLLEPLPLGNGTYDMYDPTTTNATDYINLIIKVFISIIGALGVIMIVIGGVQYMTTDAISKKEGGREMITHSIGGIILALVSVVLLYTINPHLTDVRLDPPSLDGISVKGEDDLPAAYRILSTKINGQNVSVNTNCKQGSVNAVAADGVALDKGKPWGGIPAINNNDAAFRVKLSAVGVEVNKSNCALVGDENCTSVYKLGDGYVDSLRKLRNASCKNQDASCKLILTGASECWLHESHEIGSGIVDLDPASGGLETYIKSIPGIKRTCRGWIPGQSGDGCPVGQAGQYTFDGVIFIRESNHFHVAHW